MRRLAIALALGSALAGVAGAQDRASRTYSLPHVLEVVEKAVDQLPPTGLSATDRQAWAAQTEWLRGVRDRLKAIADSSGSGERVSGAASARQVSPGTQAQRVEALKKSIESESRKFNTLSNASKARHDIAMNAIRNMKG